MIRGMILAAGALVAAVAGLMTAEAQPGRTAKMADIKRVEKVQKEFNATIDALVKLARSQAGAPARATARATRAGLDVSVVVDDSVVKHLLDTKYFVSKQGGLKLDQVVKMQKEINGRFDAMKKAGKLTELDKKILNDGTLSGMHRLIRRR